MTPEEFEADVRAYTRQLACAMFAQWHNSSPADIYRKSSAAARAILEAEREDTARREAARQA